MAVLPDVSPEASKDYQSATINQAIGYINQSQRTNKVNDGTTDRSLNGYQAGGFPNGDFGLKIAPPGKDVNTAEFNDLLYVQDYTTGTIYLNKDGLNYAQIGTAEGSIKFAKAGKDVRTATDADLQFNSAQNIFKIVKTDVINVNYNLPSQSGSGHVVDEDTQVITHNLGFTPSVLVYAQYTYGGVTSVLPVSNGSMIAGSSGNAGFTFGGGTGFAFAATSAVVAVDSTNLEIGVRRWSNLGNGAFASTIPTESGSISFKYYLLQESAT